MWSHTLLGMGLLILVTELKLIHVIKRDPDLNVLNRKAKSNILHLLWKDVNYFYRGIIWREGISFDKICLGFCSDAGFLLMMICLRILCVAFVLPFAVYMRMCNVPIIWNKVLQLKPMFFVLQLIRILILGLHPANRRRRYKLRPSLHWLGANLKSALSRFVWWAVWQ